MVCHKNIKNDNPNVYGIKFRRNYGKSAALNVGFSKASGDVVITMDADLQDSPDEIPELYNLITNDNYDLLLDGRKKDMIQLPKYSQNYSTGQLEKHQEST